MDRHLEILLAFVIVAYAATAFRPDVGNEARSSSKRVVSIGNAETLQPPFKTLQKTDDYEEREYGEGDYVNTNVTGSGFTVAYTKGISRLYAYFLGRNEDNVRMNRTHPSFTRMYPNKDFTDVVENNYTLALWVPGHFQGKAPAPTIDDVGICHVPKQRAYAREFSGFATQGKALEEGLRLKTLLLEDKIDDFDDSHLWLAVYDPPTKISHRRNEVFLDACGKRRTDYQIIEQPSTVFAKLQAIYKALFGVSHSGNCKKGLVLCMCRRNFALRCTKCHALVRVDPHSLAAINTGGAAVLTAQ